MQADLPDIQNNGMTPYLFHFLEWAASKNYSAETNKTRKSCIHRFIVWCDARGLTRPQDVSKAVIERYALHLYYYRKPNGDPLSPSTQHSQLAPIRAFFKWLNKENYILFNPAVDMELPRVPKHLPKDILSEEEINDMLNHTAVYGDIGVRDRAIMETLYSTGIRRMELVNLKVHDLDFNRGTITIFEGKWKKDRVIPIGDRAIAWVDKYRNEVRPQLVQGNDSGHVFFTEYGAPLIHNRLSDLITKYKKSVGIDKKGACHLFRNAMATHMLENGADIRYIQMMLGHVNLSSTEIYTQVTIKKLKQVHAATHPAKLPKNNPSDNH